MNNKIGSSDYTMDTNAGDTTYADGSSSFTEGSDFYWNNPLTHYYYNSSNTLTKLTANVLTELPESVSDKPSGTQTYVATLDGTPDDDGYYTDSVSFKIWIEGCDTEARRALVDGRFNLSLVLDTFGIE